MTAAGHMGPALRRRCRGAAMHPRCPETVDEERYPCSTCQRGLREQQAVVDAGGIRKHGLIRIIRLRKAGSSVSGAPICGRIPKPWVLAAFFGYFLSTRKESTTVKGGTDSHASDVGHWLRMTEEKVRPFGRTESSAPTRLAENVEISDGGAHGPRPTGFCKCRGQDGQNRPPLQGAR